MDHYVAAWILHGRSYATVRMWRWQRTARALRVLDGGKKR